MTSDAERAALVARLQGAIDALARGDEAAYRIEFDALAAERDQPLMQALARLAREVAEVLGAAPGSAELAELPDACSRLEHVVALSEASAHRTLDLVEESRALAETVQRGPLSQAQSDALAALRRNLSEVALAQSHQDLGGQIIRRVVGVVGRLHETLGKAGLIAPIAVAGPALAGPVVAGVDVHGVSQDDADALMSGLGL